MNTLLVSMSFDRGDSFDPKTDTIVRVQARRMRSKIEKYYASDGQADPVVIALPKGQYVAVFRAIPANVPTLVQDLPQAAAPGEEWLQPQGRLASLFAAASRRVLLLLGGRRKYWM